MKEIIAIIRPKKVRATKDALEALGFPCFLAVSVLGRGHQRGIAGEVSCELSSETLGQAKAGGTGGGMKYIPKRMLTIVVPDENVDAVMETVVKANQTGEIGDGKIFVCPMENAIRVRTHETGESAIL